MKVFIISICLYLAGYCAFAQTNTTKPNKATQKKIKVFTNSDWITEKSWFGDSIVVLKPLKKHILADTNQNAFAFQTWGERIQFDKQLKMTYTYSIYCPVGETLYNLKTFDVTQKHILTEYCKWKWGQEEQIYKKCYYKITKLTEKEIILQITN